MDSLFLLGVFSVFTVVVVIFSYFLIYLSNKKSFFIVWTIAWGFYVFRLVNLLLSAIDEAGKSNPLFFISSHIFEAISATLLLYGSYSFLNKKGSCIWKVLCAAVSLYLITSTVLFSSASLVWQSFPVSVFTGWVHIWNGILFLINRQNKRIYTNVAGISFIFWGIHTIHYSIDLIFLPSFMSWFYIIDASLVFIILTTILLEYFHDIQNKWNCSEKNYNLLLENSEEAVVIARDGNIISINTKGEEISGYIKDELIGKPFINLIINNDQKTAMERHIKRQQGEDLPKFNTFRIIRKSGDIRWIECNSTVFYMDEQSATFNILRDITGKKKAEQELCESKRRLLTLMSNLPGMAYRCKNNPDRTMVFVSEGALKLTGYKPEEITDNNFSYSETIHAEDRQRVWTHIQSAVSESKSFELIYRVICKNGEKWVWEKGQIVIEDGNIIALEGFISDITERKKTETALMQSLMKYEIIFQANPVWITLNSLDEKKYFEANEAFLRDTGYLQEEVVGKTSKYIDTWVNPKIREMIFKQVKETGRIHNMEVQRKNRKGEIINALFSAELLNLEGQKVMISVTQNITTLKKMQEDRDSLNEQLQHSQKMESVGRLAGGVAHDYNNMLTVIIGYAEILLSGIEEDSQEYKRINEILKAANRSANITRQLLVFARKQNIDPKVLDLNVTIDGMLTMLKRLIGENIELIWEPGKDLWQLKMDTSQIDQILVNFCVNSRDAIEYGGQILIRTENFVVDETISERYQGLVQGEYILLTFSDDGKGISKSAIEKIFDPFYTTKPVGKGTGLGLSIIYGIIKQNNGYIDVESIPNEGTTFKIYLPHYKSNGESDYQVSRDNNVESKGETILVVEDDASVRQTIEMMLVGFGYNVLTAKNPKDACDIAKRHSGNIHLLLSDVIMPNLDGRGLAKMITKLIPDIRVLFMSGYTSDSFIREGLFYKGANFIEKPFSSKKLGLKIMEVLEKK